MVIVLTIVAANFLKNAIHPSSDQTRGTKVTFFPLQVVQKVKKVEGEQNFFG